MRIRKRKLPLLLVIVGILLLLLPLLAYLQYDWLGKVSEREREQMQTALRRTLSQFSQDFDREIARIFIQFEHRPDRTENAADDYAKVYAHWNATSPYSRLIREVFLEQPGPAGERNIQRLNRSSRRWEPADWITEFGQRHELREPVDARIPAIVIPLFNFKRERPQELIEFSQNLVRVIITLDLDYIKKDFIPVLVQSYLTSMKGEYHLQISSEEDHSNVIYSSEPGTTIQGDGDATESILTLRLDEFRTLTPAEEPFIDTVSAVRTNTDHVFSLNIMPAPAFASVHALTAGKLIGGEWGGNTWKITAAHRSGSLDAAVGQIRHRNLAVSFGILALLAASVATVLVSAARAQRLARLQMEFVSAVSHELRTPLAVIRSAGENLADGVVRDPEQLKSYGKVVRNEGRRLTEMVEQILSFAGIQSGLKRQTFVPVDLVNVVERAIEALALTASENGFVIERNITEDIPPVMGEAGSLTRAVQNLISNAIKYGGAERWIGVSVFGEGCWVKIAVQDRGAGIASSDLPHIFEPFYRGSSAVERQIQGSGLGLSLVKQAVEAHGGRVDVSSNRGTGSTFCIALPIATASEVSAV